MDHVSPTWELKRNLNETNWTGKCFSNLTIFNFFAFKRNWSKPIVGTENEENIVGKVFDITEEF